MPPSTSSSMITQTRKLCVIRVSDEDCIVDIRDIVTGDKLPYHKVMNKYVVKVEPIRAILESDYFIKMIEKCEQARDYELEH